MSNYWKSFRHYLGDIPVKGAFTRRDVIERLHITPSTFDSYKAILLGNNVISSISPGVYMKLHDLPKDISISELRLRAYGRKEQYEPIFIYDDVRHETDIIYKTIGAVARNPLFSKHGSIFDYV